MKYFRAGKCFFLINPLPESRLLLCVDIRLGLFAHGVVFHSTLVHIAASHAVLIAFETPKGM